MKSTFCSNLWHCKKEGFDDGLESFQAFALSRFSQEKQNSILRVFFVFLFFEMGFWCIVLGGLEFQVFLLQCWDYRHTPPCSTNIHGPFAVSCGSWLLVFLLVNFYYVLSKQVLFSHFLRIKGMIFPLFPVSFPWAYPHQDEQVLQFWLLSVPGPLLSSCQ